MRRRFRALRGCERRRLAAALALLVWTFAGVAAAGPADAPGRVILVAGPRVGPGLAPLARGYASWLRHRLAGAGFDVLAWDGEAATGPALAEATRRRAAYAVLPDLVLRAGGAEVLLRLYAPEAGELLAVTRSRAPLTSLGSACAESAGQLLAHLGARDPAGAAAAAPLLDELAASHRALRERAAGNLGQAWREVQGKLTPTAMRLREEIVAQARRPGAPAAERARVLAATGDVRTAWSLIAAQLPARDEALSEASPQLLIAAAEVQLALGDARQALRFLEPALAREPERVDAQTALARVAELRGRPDAALAAWRRAAELDSGDPQPLARLAELERGEPTRRAALLVQAGRRAEARLDVQRAQRYFARAADAGAVAEAARAMAELEERLGRPRKAVAAYRRALAAGERDTALHVGVARSLRALGESDAAEAALRAALKQRGDDAGALRELGLLHAEAGRAQEALPLLERALETTPDDPEARRSLARALGASGRPERALEVLSRGAAEPETLREIAVLHEQAGRYAQARDALLGAIEAAPFEAALYAQLAGVYGAEHRDDLAREAAERARLLGAASGASDGLAGDDSAPPGITSFDDLVLTFSSRVSDASRRRVAHLGLLSKATWKARALDWLHPRRPDRAAIEEALVRAIGRRFELVPVAPDDLLLLEERVARLGAFDDPGSLDAETMAEVNRRLGTYGVFIARLERAPEGDAESQASCSRPEDSAIELRLLVGDHPDVASILENGDCLSGDLRAYVAWNPIALPLYAIALALLVYPLVRGWGVVVVRLDLPPRTKGFFTIRISRSPEHAARRRSRRNRMSERLQRSLRSLSRYERRMAGRESVFRWIPARRRSYVVTVQGPLHDLRGDRIIGHFLEEKRVRVRRGTTAQLQYDFSNDECAVQVTALDAGSPTPGVRAAVQGDRSSFRYAGDSGAFLYLGVGDYTILVGAGDRVAAHELQIRSLENAIPLSIDLADERRLVFAGCPAAVDPYLQGDYATAAEALESAGQADAAHRVRGALYEQRGELDRASREYEACGELERAAALRARGSDPSGAAALFERAGDFARAAEAYRAVGDPGAAARCYEAAYDYESALDCYREAGDDERVIDVLEKTGEYLDAARLSHERGDGERAIHNLQQLNARSSAYGEACKLFAEVLCDRGDFELAADRYGEAIALAGGEAAAVEMHERHAELLERAGRAERALEVYEALRRRDPARDELAERTIALRREIERGRPSPAAAEPKQRRYELLEEIGRGGMGVVWRARDRRLGRLVALKHLPENLRDHPEAVKLFLREARAAAALNHRNIVTLFDAGEEDGSYYITMELLEGQPLNVVLERRSRLSVRDTARLGLQIAAGLHYAQQQRIVHRDIKAANLFFTREHVVKIMDFGLARTLDEMRRSSTLIGGTPYYMAPEQAAGEAVDHRTDLYAFGVTLFQFVTGSVPFRSGDLAYHHRHTPAPDPRTLAPELPAALAELILQLLAKDPGDRCQSAAEVGSRLQALPAAR